MIDWHPLTACILWLVAVFRDGVFPVMWDVTRDVVVPIAAAALAAFVIVRQIRQLDRHRTEDRRAQALIALNELLYREVEFGSSVELYKASSFGRFENGKSLIRAYALLPREDAPVALWASWQSRWIAEEIKKAFALREMDSETVAAHREKASKIAADSLSTLLDWQAGDIPTSWFEAAVRGKDHTRPS